MIKDKTASHRMWLYSADGAKIFEKGEEIPVGYFDTPVEVEETETFTVDEVLSASDAAIKLASENDVELENVTGTGKDGNITKGDVEAYIEAQAA